MLYDDVVQLSQRLAATTKRTEKVSEIAKVLAQVPLNLVRPLIGFLIGEPMQGRFGVGWATVREASLGARPDDVAAEVTIDEMHLVFDRLASMSGPGSQKDREAILHELFSRMSRNEQHHALRLLTGELRQGANDGVVSDAVIKASGVTAADFRRATMLLGDLGVAADRAMRGLSLDVGLTPLMAVQPMLASTSASAGEAIGETGPASVEWKLDGIRVQAHRDGDDVRLFSRGLNDITAALPSVVEAMLALPVQSIVLDGESLGMHDDGSPRRFQDTMSGLSTSQVFFFDLLHVDGQSLIDDPLADRKRTLQSVLPAGLLLPSIETDDPVLADQFAEGATSAGHEGVVVKALDSAYQAGRRGSAWRKVKPVHTLDLVVLAAEWGHGRRVGWLSNLHLGARGTDGFVMVGKTFKGMTDAVLGWQTERLQELALATESSSRGPTTLHVRPELVVEIAIDGVQVSRRYPGGVALRFARVKQYRPEKPADQADTIERVQSFLRA